MFLKIEDLAAKIRLSDLRQITGQNDMVALHAMSYAEGIAKTYLHKYDLKKLFEAQDEQRDDLLLSLLSDIAIYEIVAIAQPNIDLTDRRERKGQAIAYLQQVKDGQIATRWPLQPSDQSNITESPVENGGTPSRGNYF